MRIVGAEVAGEGVDVLKRNDQQEHADHLRRLRRRVAPVKAVRRFSMKFRPPQVGRVMISGNPVPGLIQG